MYGMDRERVGNEAGPGFGSRGRSRAGLRPISQPHVKASDDDLNKNNDLPPINMKIKGSKVAD